MEIYSHAKINLYLKIMGKRKDGYHDIETLMCEIGLFDTIRLGFNNEEIVVSCKPEVCNPKDNLAFKAAEIFFRKTKIKKGVLIEIDKKIPDGAGLGGGSSNAASVFSALNKHYAYLFSKEELTKISLEVGTDVPFFVGGKPAIAKGVGERLFPYNISYPWNIVVIYPGCNECEFSIDKS